eukprot:CAMPEP_0198730810 /NCGR_PEP_ID=MMETSP1475-20131203/26383_1 /TAXON_ID= ORGANISM="Unidentified sp., Strain CCMP1999" /NCGR_SAMPLE_ID=MMETSP1475 /ASSEMBLY_ACC=CAM_ASM_001111 /LENGTH=975 /DNA_ID=CAMNT_0044493675 /DNA_START=31 /DNA_END=2959 /DNA_ORIENTATION=-
MPPMGRRGGRSFQFYGPDRRGSTALKPEYALDRAEQLIQVGQEEQANLTLYNIITDNQRKRQWTAKYEGIMLKLMELSVKLRKPNMIKEALHKYRALCSHQNVASLEKVTRFLVKEGEAKAEAARLSVLQDADRDIDGADDLEEIGMETAETLLLEAAGAEQSKERTDRQVVIPWMKFLWEVFRVVLDIVKSHSKLELCYHEMAKRAFQFCQRYNRFSEFRRLCDILRQHLNGLLKYPRSNTNDVQISNAETTQHFLETRFLQLQTSVELRNWQEAYRTIEDIHMLISIAKRMPRAQTMSIYYERLTQVFWMSKNYLYHAHALSKLYALATKQNRNLSAEEAQMMATKLLLASMSVPPFDSHSAMLADSYGLNDIGGAAGENAARHSRMAAILGYSSPAQRSTLIEDIEQKGITEVCHPEVKDLFACLEFDMEPLRLAERLGPVLEFVENVDEIKEYAEPIKRVAVYRLLEQLGKVYNVMKLSEVGKVASFTTIAEVERTALQALKTRSLLVRFDHQNDCILFESSLFSTDAMKEQLMSLGRRLEQATRMWNLPYAEQKREELHTKRSATVELAKRMAPEEQRENLSRKRIIEQRKEDQERRTAALEARKAALAKKKREDEERVRLKEEQERRERERQRREQEMRSAADEDGGADGQRDGEEPTGDSDYDREIQLAREKESKIKAQREAERKIAQRVKRMDYLERALREENKTLVLESWRKRCEDLNRTAEQNRQKMLEDAKRRHETDVKRKERFSQIASDIQQYVEQLAAATNEAFDAWMQDQAEEERRRMEEEQRAAEEEERRAEEERLEQRRLEEQRLEEKRMEEQRQQEEEEEERRREEELRKQEEMRKEQEAEERRRREEQQQEEERRLEEQRRQQEERSRVYAPPQRGTAAFNNSGGTFSAPRFKGTRGTGTSWRDREAQRLEQQKTGGGDVTGRGSAGQPPGERMPPPNAQETGNNDKSEADEEDLGL